MNHIEKLYECPRMNEFMTHLSQWVKIYSLKEIVEVMALNTASRKSSTVGLETAWLLSQFFHSQNRLLPLAQMMWVSLCEAARQTPIDIKEVFGTPPKASELNVEVFKKVYREQVFDKAFRWFVFLARDEKYRKDIIPFLVSQVGYRIGHVTQTVQFCEFIQWDRFYIYWFSVLYEVMHSSSKNVIPDDVPNDMDDKILRAFGAQNNTSKSPLFSEDVYQDIKQSLFDDEKSVTLEKISHVLSTNKQSLLSLWEILKLVSCETSLEAFQYTSSLFDALPFLNPEEQLKLLLIASLYIKKMAILAKPFKIILEEPLKTIEEKKAPSFFLEYAIRRGQVGKALGALQHLVEEKAINQMTLELLAFLASQNSDALMAKQNISCAYLALKNYKEGSPHALKHLYLKALVKFLAEQPKDNTVYYALSNTQKIKLGYYSLAGDFGF